VARKGLIRVLRGCIRIVDLPGLRAQTGAWRIGQFLPVRIGAVPRPGSVRMEIARSA